MNEIPLDVQRSLTPADKFLAKEFADFLERYEKRNVIEQEIRRLIAVRIDSQHEHFTSMIEKLMQLTEYQQEMIGLLEQRIDSLESRNRVLR